MAITCNNVQRTGRFDAFVRQFHDVRAAGSVNPCLTSAVLTSEVFYLYLLMISSYEDADSLSYKKCTRCIVD
jgi:uncharacterized membrane protein